MATRVSGGQYHMLVQVEARAAFMFDAGRRGEAVGGEGGRVSRGVQAILCQCWVVDREGVMLWYLHT